MYVDVHTHLTHEKFARDQADAIERAKKAGLTAIVVNGLEPESNRQILDLAKAHKEIIPALGIYPIEAVNHLVAGLPFEVKKFDVNREIEFIRLAASSGQCAAIGECGLDGYWVGEETFAEQERVFLALAEIASDYNLPLIIHTRKRERRSIELLAHHGLKKVNFHCYGGKVKWAISAAETYGWYFSIPANARKNEAFTKMLKELPEEFLLTETDAPFLAATRGERSEPAHVVDTVNYLAELKSWDHETARQKVWKNFQALFQIKSA